MYISPCESTDRSHTSAFFTLAAHSLAVKCIIVSIHIHHGNYEKCADCRRLCLLTLMTCYCKEVALRRSIPYMYISPCESADRSHTSAFFTSAAHSLAVECMWRMKCCCTVAIEMPRGNRCTHSRANFEPSFFNFAFSSLSSSFVFAFDSSTSGVVSFTFSSPTIRLIVFADANLVSVLPEKPSTLSVIYE